MLLSDKKTNQNTDSSMSFLFIVEEFFALTVHLVGGNYLSYAASPDTISLPMLKQNNSLTVLIPAASLRSRQTGVSRQVRCGGH